MSEATTKKMSEWLKEKNDKTEQSNGMKVARTVAALLILIVAVIVAFKIGWMSGAVLVVVALSMTINAWSNNDVLEFGCDLATPAAFLIFIGMLLYYTPTDPAPAAPLPGNIPAPNDSKAAPKGEIAKLRALVGKTNANNGPAFTDEIYGKITRKGNLIKLPMLMDAKWALLTDPKTAVIVEEGVTGVTVEDGVLVYASPANPAAFRVYFIPVAGGNPSDSRPMPADSK